MRKRIVGLLMGAAFTAACVAGPLAQAQSFPDKPIRIIVPASAGGPTDTLGRLLAKSLSEQNGVPVVVENKAGAAGSIGVYAAVQAPPDGYTLLVSVPDAVTVYPLVRKSAPYRSTDLTPITLVASTPYVFAVSAKLPVKTMKDFVDLSKKQKLAMSTPGTGSSGHIVMEMLKERAGIELLHVPYKGAGPAVQSVIAGETHITATSPITIKGHIDSGVLRALAVSKAARNPVLPDVPTMIESGFDDFDVSAWFGIFAPPGVPPEIADKLDAMVRSAMKSPEYMARTAALGLEVDPVSRGNYEALLAAETEHWTQLIESANIGTEE